MISIIRVQEVTEIMYGIHATPFGFCLIGVTSAGICHVSFIDKNSVKLAKKELQTSWPKAKLIRNDVITKSIVETIFSSQMKHKNFTVVVRGSDFQIGVWSVLCEIPFGTTTTYTSIAEKIGSPKAVRAVGTACGANYVCFLIPCHRVVTATGKLGGYKWGTTRKEKILAWEHAQA